jgi:predicted MFS family arabinose efflux permease
MSDAAAASTRAASSMWRPYQIYVLVLLTLITVLNYLDRGILSILQEPIKHDLRLSDWQLGLLSGPAFSIFYSLAGVPAARFADRMHRGALLAYALGVWSTMTALCGAAGGFVQLALCRVGVGMGEGGCIPISYSLLAETFHARQRGLVMSIVSAGNPMSAIITPLVAAYVAHEFGWRAAFFAVGLPGVAIAVLVRLTLKEPRAKADAGEGARPTLLADARELFGSKVFLFLFISAVFTGVGVSGVGAFRVSYLARNLHLDLTHAGGILSLAGVVGLVGSYAGGYLADRFSGPRRRSYVIVPAISGALTTIAYLVSFISLNLTVVIAALMISSFTYNLKDGPTYAAVQNALSSKMRATGQAFYMVAATAIGGGCGPMLAGGVSDFVAGRAFQGPVSYALACPGGRAAAHATVAATKACAVASADGLRVALVVVSFAFLIASVFLIFVNRELQVIEHEDAPAA